MEEYGATSHFDLSPTWNEEEKKLHQGAKQQCVNEGLALANKQLRWFCLCQTWHEQKLSGRGQPRGVRHAERWVACGCVVCAIHINTSQIISGSVPFASWFDATNKGPSTTLNGVFTLVFECWNGELVLMRNINRSNSYKQQTTTGAIKVGLLDVSIDNKG